MYVNGVTLTDAGWFNDVDALVYEDLINVKNSAYGAIGDDSTVNTTALQAALDALTSGGTVRIPRGTYRSGALTVSYADITIEMESGATLKFPTLGASTKAITVNANNFSVKGGVMQGPAAGAYVADESAIWIVGTSSASRKSGLRVIGTEIKNFGGYGIYGKWLDDIWLDRVVTHDIGGSGATFLSCDNGIIESSKSYNITPGAASEPYGFSLTHNSTGYAGGGKAATNPFCRGWQVIGNEVYGSAWQGIDCHAGYEISIIGNRVYGARQGISLPTSSGDAANYSGFTNIIANNIVDVRNRDGSASGQENLSGGINVSGGSLNSQAKVIVANNLVHGYGQKDNAAAHSIGASYCNNVIIQGNIITSWGGQAIVCGNSNVSIIGNLFGDVADAADTRKFLILHDTGTSNRLHIVGNVHDPLSGNAAAGGIRLNGSTTPDVFAAGNDFTRCSNSSLISHTAATYMRGGGFSNVVLSAADDATPSVKNLAGGGHGTLIINASTGIYNLTTLDDGEEGQVVTILNVDTDVVTVVNGATMKLPGASNVALGQYDSLTLTKINGGVWCANGTSNN